jgi:hypothetical protein
MMPSFSLAALTALEFAPPELIDVAWNGNGDAKQASIYGCR